MRLQDYFSRTGYTGPVAPTLHVLTAMLRTHVLSVPFEALDVQLGRPVTIDPEAAYDKIVSGKRGGWCYEQNGLFGWALTEVGFEVVRVAAAVHRAERGSISAANHLCLLVQTEDTDATWLADVGFGGSMIAPIALKSAEYEQAPFRLGLRRTDDGHWQFWEDIGNGEFSFDFRAEAADESALAEKCEYLQTSPDSGFVQRLVAQIRMPDAHKSLRGKLLTHASTTGLISRVLESPQELVAVLRDTFSLDIPDVAQLWPRIE